MAQPASRTALNVARFSLLGTFAVLVLSACHNGDCQLLGFEEGERFQLTVVGRPEGRPSCNIAPLAAGDTLIVTAGALRQESGNGCSVRSAAAVVPGFAQSLLIACEPEPRQLGLSCHGAPVDGAVCMADMRLGPIIKRGVDRIDDGQFEIAWTKGCGVVEGYCDEVYLVRIDRLPPA
ncbi:MAG: hypothetical protein JWM82_2047 [Myxococcales bacterium]|nr:hypothetical protein [Myxococcales bacterium]